MTSRRERIAQLRTAERKAARKRQLLTWIGLAVVLIALVAALAIMVTSHGGYHPHGYYGRRP